MLYGHGKEKSMDGPIHIIAKKPATRKKLAGEIEYKPRTAFGRRLMKLRQKAIAKGMVLLSADEILEESRRRRDESGYSDY
jgi:hypothetical protein